MDPAPVTKVVHLITLLEFGGAQGNTIYTVQHLDPNDFEAHLWSGEGAYWDKHIQTSIGLQDRLCFFRSLVRPLNPLLDIVAVFQLWAALKKFKPNILHTHSSKAGIIGRLSGWLAGVPIIIHTFHGFGFNNEQRPLTRWLFILLEKVTAPLTEKLIFVSESNMKTAEKLHIGKNAQYALIRSGVAIQKIKDRSLSNCAAEVRSDMGIPSNARIVVTMGAFKPQKNLFDFLTMAKKVADTLPDTHFLILGDGVLRPALEKRIQELNLTRRVHMPGWCEDAWDIVVGSDVFVMTSLWEGLPRALVEAMILGVSPVCYETDGIKDLLNFEEGTLVPQRDVKALSAQVLRLLSDQKHRKYISEAVRQRIDEDFDIDAMVRQQEKLYKSLMSR